MRRAALVVPGRLDTRTGGYIYDRRLVEGLRACGWSIEVIELDASFPFPTPAAYEEAERALATLVPGTIALIDSLAFGAMPGLVAREASRLVVVGLVHAPLSAGVGLDGPTVARFERAERAAVEAAALVVATGRATLDLLARHRMRPRQSAVVEPGTDPAPLARGSGGQPVQLLSVATLAAGKGHELLFEALAGLTDLDWRLTCAGSTTRDPATAAHTREAVERLGLDSRVSLVGDLDPQALADRYDRADLFVHPSQQETFGMAVAEALARGLPVVATATGAIGELVGEQAGLVVPPGDGSALGCALRRVVGEPAFRAELAAGARQVRPHLRTWDQASTRMAEVLSALDLHA